MIWHDEFAKKGYHPKIRTRQEQEKEKPLAKERTLETDDSLLLGVLFLFESLIER